MINITGKIKQLFTVLAATLIFANTAPAMASKLPDDVWTYVKKQIPAATQRFDSVVVVGDGTMYVPLYPAQKADVKELSVEYTYPSNMSLSKKPEVVIFNNNYVLLKLFKEKDGSYTVTKNQNLPLKVKLGVMPQDMLVPVGLKIPEGLKLILGDLDIPQKGDNLITVSSETKFDEGKDAKGKIIPLAELKNKKTVISTDKSKFVLVYDGKDKSSLYELKLNGLPSRILASNATKFALVLYFENRNLEIIDLSNERVVTQIALDNTPKDADLDMVSNTAYVASSKASTIYAVDLNSATLTKAIKLEQSPSKVAVSSNGKSLAFYDNGQEKLYVLNLTGEEYISKYLCDVKNISKLIYKDNKIYVISRLDNKLRIYDDNQGTLLSEVELDDKPVDAVAWKNRIYILCAKEGIVDVYDTETNKIIDNVFLDKTGFYTKITIIPNQPNALITGIQTKKFILFNLEKLVISKKQNANINVSNIIIIDSTESKETL